MGRYSRVPGTEAFTKRAALTYARGVGCIVVDTATNRRTARAGIPDAFITHRSAAGRWLAVDFKSPSGRASPEQQALVDAGALDIVDSVGAIVAAIKNHFPGITK